MIQKIIIDKEFEALIPALSQDEFRQLRENIRREGCRDPLAVWKDHDILLDGHHRYRICTQAGIEFKTVNIELADREAAKDWIDRNQLGRRNLTPDQMSLLRGRRYNRVKKSKGAPVGNNNRAIQKGQNELIESTADRIAKDHGVSPATIKRDGKYAEAVESLGLEKPVAQGTIEAPKKTIVEAAETISHLEPAEQNEIIAKGEKEILAKAKEIRAKKREAKRAQIISDLENIKKKEAKAVQGVYDVVVVDPPWPMKKIERDERPNQCESDYPTMTEQELAGLKNPAADNCHIWLWTTHKFLPMAMRLLGVWGLKYVCIFTWHKPGGFQPYGLPQYNSEIAIYARRGAPVFVDTKAFPVCFNANRQAHSVKPKEFYKMVCRVTRGRRLDMFNRREIDGFEGWGKETA